MNTPGKVHTPWGKLREMDWIVRMQDRYGQRQLWCEAYELARSLSQGGPGWNRFCDDPDWNSKGPKKDDQAQSLKWLAKFITPKKKTYSLYYRALKPFADRRASRRELEEALEKHGVKKLASPAFRAEPTSSDIGDDAKKGDTSEVPEAPSLPDGWIVVRAALTIRESDFEKVTDASPPMEGVALSVTVTRRGKSLKMKVDSLRLE